MKERIKGAFTKRKILHFLKMALFVVALSLILLSLLGTVAHATGLVDDTINAENLYSKYPLSNYQLDFYVDNSWSWLPWNWLDGIGKSVQYGLYCITNFVWTISLYLSNATGYVVQEAYKLDFINDMADSIGKSILQMLLSPLHLLQREQHLMELEVHQNTQQLKGTITMTTTSCKFYVFSDTLTLCSLLKASLIFDLSKKLDFKLVLFCPSDFLSSENLNNAIVS